VKTYGSTGPESDRKWATRVLGVRKKLPQPGDPTYADQVGELADELGVRDGSVKAALTDLSTQATTPAASTRPGGPPQAKNSEPLDTDTAGWRIQEYLEARSPREGTAGERLATALYELIRSGELTPGTHLSIYLLSGMPGIPEPTAKQVLMALRQVGMLELSEGSSRAKVAEGPHRASLEDVVDKLPKRKSQPQRAERKAGADSAQRTSLGSSPRSDRRRR